MSQSASDFLWKAFQLLQLQLQTRARPLNHARTRAMGIFCNLFFCSTLRYLQP